jgi:hypothetical protein
MFIELGLAVVGLALLARLANKWGFSAIPLYLLAGLIFGKGGLAPLKLTEDFIRTGAKIGVLLLLFMLGLEYSGEELTQSLRTGFPAGIADFVLNFTPGVVAGLLSAPRAKRVGDRRLVLRNCVVDEGRSLGVVLQGRAPNHLPLLRSKAVVVLCHEDAQASCCAKDEGSDPSKSPCRRRLQTAISCCESKARWW